MEISYLSMYLFTRLNNILTVTAIVGLVSLVTMMCYFVEWRVETGFSSPRSNVIANSKKHLAMATIPFLICALILVLVPSQKEMAAIYIVPKVVNNEQVQTITKDGLSVVSRLVALSNKYLVDLENNQKEEKEK